MTTTEPRTDEPTTDKPDIAHFCCCETPTGEHAVSFCGTNEGNALDGIAPAGVSICVVCWEMGMARFCPNHGTCRRNNRWT